MDALTHAMTGALVGRAAGQSGASRLMVWAAAAAAPDLDALSALAGRAAYYTLHRVALHSVAGIALIALAAGMLARRLGLSRRTAAAIAAGAASSHLLLDAATSFGTEIWFPFSRARIEWDVLFIVDLAFSGLALLFLFLSWRLAEHGNAWARVGVAALVLYTGAAGIGRGVVESRVRAAQADGVLPEGAVAVLPQPPSAGVWAAFIRTPEGSWAGRVSVTDAPPRLRHYSEPAHDALLDAALGTPAARRFLSFARFPHISRTEASQATTFLFEDLRFSLSGWEHSNWWYGVRVDVGPDNRVQYAGFANP